MTRWEMAKIEAGAAPLHRLTAVSLPRYAGEDQAKQCGRLQNSYPRSFQLRYFALHPVARTASATNVKRQDSRGGQIVALGAGGLGCGYSDPPARITRRLGMRKRPFLFTDVAASRGPSTLQA